jgi:hypothetical protein
LAIAVAVAGLVLVCGVSVWRWPVGGNTRPQANSAGPATPDRAQIASQAKDALGLMGSILLHAGVHSEKVISDRAVAPVRNSLQVAKNKIIHDIEL